MKRILARRIEPLKYEVAVLKHRLEIYRTSEAEKRHRLFQ
jgi:hypothetical protein